MKVSVRRGIWPGLVIGLLLALSAAFLRGQDPIILSNLRSGGFDTLQRLYPRERIDLPVRVINIDEDSLKRLGQWPWARSQIARIVERLGELGAAVIVFDIIFPEPDRLSPSRIAQDRDIMSGLGLEAREQVLSSFPDNDRIFANALRRHPAVLAFANTPGELRDLPVVKPGFAQTGQSAIAAPPSIGATASNIPELAAAASGVGGISLDLAAEQGIARQIPMLWTDGTNFYPSLVLEALRVAQGLDTIIVNASNGIENAIESIRVGDFDIPVAENGLFAIHYRRDHPSLYVSAWKILDEMESGATAPLVEGHVVFIGASAAGLLDVRTTALGETVPGVSIHAQAIEQILSNSYLTRPEWAAGAEIGGTALLAFAVAIFAMIAPPAISGSAMIVTLAGIAAGTVYFFRAYGLMLDATYPSAAMAATYLATLAFRLLVTDRDRRMLRGAFSHFVAPSILAQIERDPQALKLGGEVRDVTVMFVDIRNFTPLSEKLPPDKLVTLLNRLLDVCSECIIAAGGTIDKFVGDGIMAFWNAPIAIADHQWQAARAALAIREVVSRFSESPDIAQELKAIGAWPLRVGIGISSGPACVGNMGSQERFDYSVIGETVNVAARAETATKHVAADIVIAGEIEDKTRELALLDAGFVAMKGKSSAARVTAVAGGSALAHTAHFAQLQEMHGSAVAALHGGRKAATRKLAACIERVREFAPELEPFYRRMGQRAEDYA